MPPERGWKLRISDILDAINAIQEYTAESDLPPLVPMLQKLLESKA